MSNTIMQHEPQQDPRTTKLPESPRELAPGALPEAHSGGRGVWVWLVVLLLIAGIVTLVIYRRHGQSGQAGGPGGARGGMANFPVPVVAGVVSKQDVPIYLDGLGTVQAFNTVTVRSRVDGQLQKIMFTEGAEVKAGQVLAQIDPEPLKTQVAQAEAKKAQDEAQLANAQIELRRDEALFKDKILAQDAFDTQKALVQQLQAAVQADQAALENTKVQLGYTTIDAPIAGRVGIRQVDQGNMIHATDSNGLVVLTQLKPISVLFTLPEQTLREIQKQSSSEPMTVVAMDRDNKTELDRGQLTVIDNQIDTTTGTIKIKAAFPNENLKLWPGQFVNARLLLTVRQGGAVVPASVIQRGPEGPYAFVIKEDQTVEIRPIKVGPIEQEMALIEQGLQAGERVVVDGQYRLQPGSKVNPSGQREGRTGPPGAGGKRPGGAGNAGKPPPPHTKPGQ